MKFFDRASFSTRVITDEGFMSATAKVGRPGVQEYVKGVDFNDEDLPDSLKAKPFGTLIKVLRTPAAVFNPNSMKSFEHKPITNNHPKSRVVDSSNVKDLQVGFSKDVRATADGEAIEATILVQDAKTIKQIELGKDQISLGYEAEIDFVPGMDTDHGAYDGIMNNIQGNHIAIVDRARAGTDFRLNDTQPNEGKVMKTRVIDGKSIELSDDAADIFDAIKADNAAKDVVITGLKTKVADSAVELDTVKGERDAAKANVVNDDAVNAQVAKQVKARMALVDAASKVIDGDLSTQTDKEIRLAVIKKLSDSKVVVADDATDDYINAAYSALLATHKPKATALGDGLSGDAAAMDSADKAREAMVAKRGK